MQGNTFLTESKQPEVAIDSASIHMTDGKAGDKFGISTIQQSKEQETAAQTSFIQA